MDIFGILTMVGGLALFLFGMNAMGQGLEKLSGSRLERILEKMTSNPFKAIMLGALVTAVIQSSSATHRRYYGCQYRYDNDLMAVVAHRNTG